MSYDNYTIPKEWKVKSVAVQEITTNPHCRIYCTREPIASGYYHWEAGRDNNTIDPDNNPEIFQLLKDIKGVSSILLNNSYQLMISKSKAYDWSELEPRICDILHMLDV